eukprot:4722038-Prorocentrum_lima.AAC.1
MTSSLVGSEMCIRDSNSTEHNAFLRRSQLAYSRGVLHAAPSNAKPVSYTHLTLPTICSV